MTFQCDFSWQAQYLVIKRRVRRVAVQQTGEKWHAAVAKSTFGSENAKN